MLLVFALVDDLVGELLLVLVFGRVVLLVFLLVVVLGLVTVLALDDDLVELLLDVKPLVFLELIDDLLLFKRDVFEFV